MKLSLVITILNEQDNVQPLLESINKSLVNYDFEVILVDDGSTDLSVKRILEVANPNVKTVVLRKNFGQTAAMKAGIEAASGDFIITLDGDLQNDPADIPMMLKVQKENDWDVVAGRRANRQDGMFLRKIPSKIANSIIRKLTGVYISDYGCTLKVFKADIAKNLGLYGELHRFIPVLAKLQGASITEIDVKHHARIHGASKYGIGRTLKVMSDLLLVIFLQKYAQRPMHLFGGLGIISLLGGIFINLYLLFEKVSGKDIWGRPILILGVILLISGIQLITFGVIAELIMRTYFEAQNKHTYRIKQIYIGKEKA